MKFINSFLYGLLITYSIIITAAYFVSNDRYINSIQIPLTDTYETIDIDYRCELNEDCLYLAEALYYEGRGESVLGKIAIGHVILNRVSNKHYPSSIKKVIYQPYQFSYTRNNKQLGYYKLNEFNECKYIAKMILLGLTEDPTKGATHYLNPSKVKRQPKWTKHFTKLTIIGNHDFYKG